MNTPYTCDSHHKQYHHCAHLDSLLLHSYNISKDKWNAKLRINMSWICFTILVAVKCRKAILFQKNKNKKCSKNKKNHQRHYQRIKLLLRFSRMRYRKVIGYQNGIPNAWAPPVLSYCTLVLPQTYQQENNEVTWNFFYPVCKLRYANMDHAL